MWALDFQAEQTADGRPIRMVNVIDEHTRQVNAGREPIVSLQRRRSPRGGLPASLPSVATYERAVDAWLRKFPVIRLWTAWNEPNYTSQPTRNSPFRAGEFWALLNQKCRSRRCVVAAGDFADGQTLTSDYLRSYFRGMGRRSSGVTWAIHAHQAVRTGNSDRIEKFLAWKPVRNAARRWITEAGTYRFRSRSFISEQTGAQRLNQFLSSAVVARFSRFYYYKYLGESTRRADYGLTNSDGTRREAYCIHRTRTNPGPCP